MIGTALHEIHIFIGDSNMWIFMIVFYCYILTESVQTADMVHPACNSPESCDLTTSPTSSLPTQSGQSSAASGKVEKFLLLEAVLSFIHSAVSSLYVIWFHVHVLYIIYTHCILCRTGRMWTVISFLNLKKKCNYSHALFIHNYYMDFKFY